MDKNVEKLNRYFEGLINHLTDLSATPLFSFAESLSLQDLKAIYFVGQNETSSMRSLSRYLGLSAGAGSIIVSKLEKKILMRREHSKIDRRIVYINLTKNGQKIHKLMLKKHLEISQNILQCLDQGEQKKFIDLWDKIAHCLHSK